MIYILISIVFLCLIAGYIKLDKQLKANKVFIDYFKKKMDEVDLRIIEMEDYAYTDIRMLQDYLKAVEVKMQEWGVLYDKTRKN